jgi:prepilin-type N-terminal cleavage/methylation domain-containing protein
VAYRKGFTLVEVLTVLIIIGILISLAWPNYTNVKELAVNREAIANLRLMQAAERTYHLENNFYYTPTGIDDLNSELKLSLTEQNWLYNTDATGQCTALRATGYPPGYYRGWYLGIGNDDPTCVSPAGKGCPP